MAEMEGKICQQFSISSLKSYQHNTIQSLLDKKDAFVSKKTGAGKSMCYQGFSTAFGDSIMVIVVSPLNSIMEEQCVQLNAIGIKSVILGKHAGRIEEDVVYLFSSPELLLGNTETRAMLKTQAQKGRIGLIAVDEAHLVLQW